MATNYIRWQTGDQVVDSEHPSEILVVIKVDPLDPEILIVQAKQSERKSERQFLRRIPRRRLVDPGITYDEITN